MRLVQSSGLQSVTAMVGVVHKQPFELGYGGVEDERYDRATKQTQRMGECK